MNPPRDYALIILRDTELAALLERIDEAAFAPYPRVATEEDKLALSAYRKLRGAKATSIAELGSGIAGYLQTRTDPTGGTGA